MLNIENLDGFQAGGLVMKIKKSRLKQIIKEELEAILDEEELLEQEETKPVVVPNPATATLAMMAPAMATATTATTPAAEVAADLVPPPELAAEPPPEPAAEPPPPPPPPPPTPFPVKTAPPPELPPAGGVVNEPAALIEPVKQSNAMTAVANTAKKVKEFPVQVSMKQGAPYVGLQGKFGT